MFNLVHVLLSDVNHTSGGTQARMRFLALLLVSSSCGQDTLFRALQSAKPGVRYQVVTTEEGVTLLQLEEDDKGLEETDTGPAEQGGGGLDQFEEVGRWIQRPQNASLRKVFESRQKEGSLGLVEEATTSRLRKRGGLSDSQLRRLWLEFNSRGSVSLSGAGGSSVLETGDLWQDIVRKTEPGVWYQFTRDERGERLVQAKTE